MRNALKTFSILLLLAAAAFLPVTLSGYSELKQALAASHGIEAAQHYQAAAQRIFWRADLYEKAGHEYFHAREYALADAAYRKAHQRRALSVDGWVAWGDVNYQNRNPERAAEIWQQGLDKTKSEKLFSRLALVFQDKKDYAAAARYLQEYAVLYPQDASAHYRLGLLLTLTDPDAALAEFISASQLNPELDPASQTMRSALNLASLTASLSDQKVILGRGLALVGEWELAQVAFDQAVRADVSNAEAWAWLGEAYQQTAVLNGAKGQDEALEQSRITAKAYLDQALTLNPNSVVVRILRGLFFQRVGDHRSAVVEFQVAIALQPDDPAFYVSMGESYAVMGDLIRALEAYQYAASLDAQDATYWRLLAQFCADYNIHLRDVGVPAAQRIVALNDEDAEAQDLLGWLLLLEGRLFEAERHLLRALELNPSLGAAHHHLGMVYLQTGDRAAAYDHLLQARDLGNADAQGVLSQYFP
jgi:tetratricopeptide (TPR) repeat protein